MKNIFLIIFATTITACSPPHIYTSFNKNVQQIPGRVECEYYDKGGEGIAYQDVDIINNGSGKLNPANGNFYNEFRMKEGVDISYTKANGVDDNPYNQIETAPNQLYVGWTMPGEWINYTVKVTETADYKVGVMYTANGDGLISLDLDGRPLVKTLKIKSTHNNKDTVEWRQWHHWNKTDSLTTIKIRKGIHKIKLNIVDHGQMNFNYLEFAKD